MTERFGAVFGSSEFIWYAAYGSNLLGSRFQLYLNESRSARPPRRSAPYRLPGQVLFGNSSSKWGDGGVCFLDLAPSALNAPSSNLPGSKTGGRDKGNTDTPGGVFGRAWLISREQFADVWTQENGRPVDRGGGPTAVDRALSVVPQEVIGPTEEIATLYPSDSGWYRRLVLLGSLDGIPVATFTSHHSPELRAAHLSYLAVVGAGLVEAWGLSPAEASTYLAACPGNRGVLGQPSLEAFLDTNTQGPLDIDAGGEK